MENTLTRNTDHDGIEITFASFPTAETRSALKSNHFRWNPAAKVWYNRFTAENVATAEQIAGVKFTGEAAPVTEPVKDFQIGYTENEGYMGNKGWTGVNFNTNTDLADVNKLCKAQVSRHYPEVKVSAKLQRYSGGEHTDVTITMPSEYENNGKGKEIKQYAQDCWDSFSYNKSNSMVDYFDHGAYCDIRTEYTK